MEEQEPRKKRNYITNSVKEPYTRERMESIKHIVSRYQKNGKDKLFSISVDGEIVVPKTSDVEQFDDYLEYMNSHTHYIEVRTYFGHSFNCNVYRLTLKEQIQQNTLQGIPQLGALEVQEKINDALSKQKLENDVFMLEKENHNLRKKLKGFKKLQAKLDEKQIDISELFTKGIELFGAFQAKKLASTAQVQGLPTPPAAEVEITPELSEVDQHFNELKREYSDKQILNALQASELFAKFPELRSEFQAIVNAKIKQNGQT